MFIALIEQEGGCDYRIDCGKTWMRLKSASSESALQELREYVLGHPIEIESEKDFDFNGGSLHEEGYWGENRLSAITVLEIKQEIEIPLQDWYAEALALAERKKEEFKLHNRRAVYEKLKAEFEK